MNSKQNKLKEIHTKIFINLLFNFENQRENFEISKTEATSRIQSIHSKI